MTLIMPFNYISARSGQTSCCFLFLTDVVALLAISWLFFFPFSSYLCIHNPSGAWQREMLVKRSFLASV